MIKYVQGDILKAQTEALVNTVNCVGVMGKGIALSFKKAFPDNFKAYEKACKRKEMKPGKMFVYETNTLTYPHYIINFPTKRHWRGNSRIEDIELGMKALIEVIRSRNIRSVAIPPLGCGLGGLNWEEVRLVIENAFSTLPEVDVQVFEPGYKAEINKNMSAPKMTIGRAALIGLIERYLAALMDPTITLLEIHKLTYFLQSSGEPLRLRFVKAKYGPYAENLRHVLSAMDGYYITGFSDKVENPNKQLDLVPGAVEDAKISLEKHPTTRKRFEKVTQLVEGFETPLGLELLSTVHWLINKEQYEANPEVLLKAVHSWVDRKSCFTSAQVSVALEQLNSKKLKH